MSLPRVQPREAALLWYGVFGAAGAWTIQHVAGFALTQAQCNEAGAAGWQVHMDAWIVAVSAAAAVVAIGSGVAAALTFRATRDAGSEPPRGRMRFLSVIGMVIAPLFLAMILMSGLGSILLTHCVQG